MFALRIFFLFYPSIVRKRLLVSEFLLGSKFIALSKRLVLSKCLLGSIFLFVPNFLLANVFLSESEGTFIYPVVEADIGINQGKEEKKAHVQLLL